MKTRGTQSESTEQQGTLDAPQKKLTFDGVFAGFTKKKSFPLLQDD